MILCVAGNPSIDKLFEVDRVTRGAIHRPSALIQVPGGKGLNVARAAAALGARVRVTGILAGHAGRWIEEALGAEGVEGLFVWTGGETKVSLSVADRETRRLTEFYEDGPPLDHAAWKALQDVVRGLLPGPAWVTLSGSLPPGAPVRGYAELVGMAGAAGGRTVLDARGPALRAGVAAGPDVVKINAAEAAELLETAVGTEDEALRAARDLRRWAGAGNRVAVVTRGVDGAVLAAPDGTCWRGTLDAWGPYPVGSGDSFLAGMVVGLDRGDRWPAALAMALGAAAANAEAPGAGRLDPARAAELATQAAVSEVE